LILQVEKSQSPPRAKKTLNLNEKKKSWDLSKTEEDRLEEERIKKKIEKNRERNRKYREKLKLRKLGLLKRHPEPSADDSQGENRN
jgi:hypothetical protein